MKLIPTRESYGNDIDDANADEDGDNVKWAKCAAFSSKADR